MKLFPFLSGVNGGRLFINARAETISMEKAA